MICRETDRYSAGNDDICIFEVAESGSVQISLWLILLYMD